jgi:NAD(P)-dependent dehydrogenase (short-subunit alcohol dehydrogenase family)
MKGTPAVERRRRTARKQRALQDQTETLDDKHNDDELQGAMQAGARRYPEPPLPKQHQTKPGDETLLDPLPMYDAPYYKGSEKLLNKVALITGGDSGIGRAVAVLFAREGADVAIVYLEEHRDANVTKHAVEREGRRCIAIAGDVTEARFCRRAVKQTIEEFGALNILVNNAAFQLHATRFEDLTDEHFDQTLKTNLYGYFNMTRAAMPHLTGGVILNTGSVTGINGSKHLLDYSMTKGGIHAFTRSLASLLMSRGIRVNAGGTRSGVDAVQSGRRRRRSHRAFRRERLHETSGPTGRNRARVRVPCVVALRQLHHRRNSAGDRRLLVSRP